MKIKLLFNIGFVLNFLIIAYSLSAQERKNVNVFYVSESGNDANPGTIQNPWKTVQKAADTLEPGDTVFLRGGVYREYVKPTKGGKDNVRVTYKAYPGETPVITGSDRITGWKNTERNIWKVVIPDSVFKGYNPYTINLEGEFLFFGQENHVGDVYLNGNVFNEVRQFTDVSALPHTWMATHSDKVTTIYANFGGYDPNKELTELVTRECVFFPAVDGLQYITIDGITFRHAATNWVEYHGLQKAVVGTRMGYKWIIQNCHISDGKTCGISSGLAGRWPRNENNPQFGYHIFCNNLVERLGQAGFIGSTGYFASTIEGNLIQDINFRRQFSGAESAGIKMHAPIDVTIRNNIIRRVYLSYVSTDAAKGIWMDFSGQGFRISGNVLYDIEDDAMNLEACHGPGLVDNNIIVGAPISSGCEGLVLVNNVMVNSGIGYHNHEQRSSEYNIPHTLKSVGSGVFSPREDRYFNNVFVGNNIRTGLPKESKDFKAGSNVFLKGAIPTQWDLQSLVDSTFDPRFKITDLTNGAKVNFKMNSAMNKLKCPIVTRDFVGINTLTKQGIEDHEGNPINIDKDLMGVKRNPKKNIVGAFVKVDPELENSFIVRAGPANSNIIYRAPPEPQARIKRGGGFPMLKIRKLASAISLEQIQDSIKAIAPVPFLYKDQSIGSFQFAIAGEYLAVRATIKDARITPELKDWPETSVDVFASLPGITDVSQVAFHIGGKSEKRHVTYHTNGIERKDTAIKWIVNPMTDSGYELTALIPLYVINLSNSTTAFLFEGALFSSPAKGAPVQYLTLFGSNGAFKYNQYFALCLLESAMK